MVRPSRDAWERTTAVLTITKFDLGVPAVCTWAADERGAERARARAPARAPLPRRARSYPSGRVALAVCRSPQGCFHTFTSDADRFQARAGAGGRPQAGAGAHQCLPCFLHAAAAGRRRKRGGGIQQLGRVRQGATGGHCPMQGPCSPHPPARLPAPPQVLATFDADGMGGVNHPDGKPWCARGQQLLGRGGTGHLGAPARGTPACRRRRRQQRSDGPRCAVSVHCLHVFLEEGPAAGLGLKVQGSARCYRLRPPHPTPGPKQSLLALQGV
jgi:hypothetical protein